jgi:hypothetical protein
MFVISSSQKNLIGLNYWRTNVGHSSSQKNLIGLNFWRTNVCHFE